MVFFEAFGNKTLYVETLVPKSNEQTGNGLLDGNIGMCSTYPRMLENTEQVKLNTTEPESNSRVN